MNCHLAHNRVVLLQLDALGSILAVLRGDVPRSTGHTTILVLCALENHLNPVAFLCHDCRVCKIGAQKYRFELD